MTYEGSTTYPGCWETVTWIVMNKPIYLTRKEMADLRNLKQGDKINPKAPLSRNIRPLQPMSSRTIRTNIAFLKSGKGGGNDIDNNISKNDGYGMYGSDSLNNDCPDVIKHATYKANTYLEATVGK